MIFTFALAALVAVVHGAGNNPVLGKDDCKNLGFPADEPAKCKGIFEGWAGKDAAKFCGMPPAYGCCPECDTIRKKAIVQAPLEDPKDYCKGETGEKCKLRTACVNAGGKECGTCINTKNLCGNKASRSQEEVASFLLQASDRTDLILVGCSALFIVGAALWYANYRKTGDEYEALIDEEEA